jgi:hypothetical protein
MMRTYFSLVAAVVFGVSAQWAAAQDDDVEGGILGTGIVGTITALGSIHVNGQHIGFAPDLAIADGVAPLSATQLRTGQTVAVIAEPQGQDWQARHIRMVYPLVGPVDVAPDGGLTVMGTQVLSDQTFEAGEWIAVSGLWQGEQVVASDIERLGDYSGPARITGTYLTRDALGQFEIGGTTLVDLPLQHIAPGAALTAFGTPTEDGLIATRVETGLFQTQVGVIQVEGYYSPPQPDGMYTVLGSGLLAYTDQPGMIDPQVPVVRCGVDAQLVSAEDAPSALCAAE